jgi:hypothetical protein
MVVRVVVVVDTGGGGGVVDICGLKFERLELNLLGMKLKF